jgi:hypothetical protein
MQRGTPVRIIRCVYRPYTQYVGQKGVTTSYREGFWEVRLPSGDHREFLRAELTRCRRPKRDA